MTELHYGRGAVMSAHEYAVMWPAYWRSKRRQQEHAEATARRGGRRV